MPIKDIRPFNEKATNAEIMAAIRRIASSDYQARVPEATKGDIQASIAAMMDYSPARNEFITEFVNKIGMTIARNFTWTNPLAVLKIGMMQYGDTIEEYHTGLTKAYTYDPDRVSLEKTLFGREPNEVQVSYHRINRENYYKLTVNDTLLRRAFQSPTGLAQLINQLMAVPVKSDNLDEFLLMTSLFKEAHRQNSFYKIHIDDIGAYGSDAPQAKYAIRRVRELNDTLPFISRKYNAAHMPSHAEPEDLIMFITPEVKAAMDVEALAAAFNIDKSSLPNRMIVIPAEYIDIPGFQMLLTTKDFFVVADTVLETRSISNPADLHQNFFYHHHQIISFSRYVPAILFWTGESDDYTNVETPVIDVAQLVLSDRNGVVVTEATRDDLYSVSGAAVTLPEGGWNTAVRFQLSGNNSPQTFITNTGTLHVSASETSEELTVTAIAVDNNAFSESLVIPITGRVLKLWPVPETSQDGDIEVVPEKPTQTANVIHVPTIEGVVYKVGAAVIQDDYTLTANQTVTASALPGYEIPSGVIASWDYVRSA